MTEGQINLLLEIAGLLGTFLVVALAIWGDWFKDKFASPILELRLKSSRGFLINFRNGQKVHYYHLAISNRKSWVTAKNVNVVLTSVMRLENGVFKAEPLAAEVPLTWANQEYTSLNQTLGKNPLTCDFGYLAEQGVQFIPTLHFYPNNFNGYVTKGETIRYALELRADNYKANKPLVLEVFWDGIWTADSEVMQQHLSLTEISPKR